MPDQQASDELGRFPFGAPVARCGDGIPRATGAFVLGAYPSAVHVRWDPPSGTQWKSIKAIAVDNEPDVFWSGDGAAEIVELWRSRHFDEAWGTVAPADLNGPSGIWVRDHVRAPLIDVGLGAPFITDCLATYRLSNDAARAIADRYTPFVASVPELQDAAVGPHPSESRIVAEAVEHELTRLSDQINAARPELIITLGNAAARVLAAATGFKSKAFLHSDTYGQIREVTLDGLNLRWLPLIHPASPPIWQGRHQDWSDYGGIRSLG